MNSPSDAIFGRDATLEVSGVTGPRAAIAIIRLADLAPMPSGVLRPCRDNRKRQFRVSGHPLGHSFANHVRAEIDKIDGCRRFFVAQTSRSTLVASLDFFRLCGIERQVVGEVRLGSIWFD